MSKFNVFLSVILLSSICFAQNWTTVTASSVVVPSKLNGTPQLVTGKLCFTGTDASDRAISFQVGGGGQAVVKTVCGKLTAGVLVDTLQIPNPANTAPANIRYRIEVTDSTGVVLRYKLASISGDSFDFDSYIPATSNIPIGYSFDTITVSHLRVIVDCIGAGCGSGGGGTAGVASFNGSTGVVTYTPTWSSITGKPTTFPPSAHTHVFADLPNCSADGQVYKRVSGVMACAADATGTGGTAGVSSFNSQTGDVSYAPAWTDITSKPSTFAPSSHTHAESEVTGLVSDLAAKASSASLATVATSGRYDDLSSKPTIPAAQVQSDWNAVSGLGVILNKPSLFDGTWASLSGKPTTWAWANLTGVPTSFTPTAHASTHASAGSDPVTISESQVTSLTAHLAAKTDSSSLATVATSGSYADLQNKPHTITIPISGAPIATGTLSVGSPARAGFSCTINSASIVSPTSGSITVAIWKTSGAIPTSANVISASAPVSLSSATVNGSASLTGWTTSVSSGDIFWASVTTADGVLTSATIQLGCQ